MLSYPRCSAVYSLLVAVAGLGALASSLVSDWGALTWLPILIFAGLSTLAQRASTHAGSRSGHSLAGVIDVAAVLALGPTAGAVVAASSSLMYPGLDALRQWRSSRRFLVQVPLFNAGLKALLALLGGELYGRLGGAVPLSNLDGQSSLAAGVLCVVWFALNHLGWGIRAQLAGGLEGLRLFLQDLFPRAVLIELLPLPFSVVVALVYARLSWVAFAFLVLILVAVSLLVQRWVADRSALVHRVAELSTIEQVGRAIAEAQLDVDELCRLMYEHACRIVDTTIFHLGLFDGDSYTLKLWMRQGKPELQQTFQLRPDEGLVSWLRESKQPILVPRASDEFLYF